MQNVNIVHLRRHLMNDIWSAEHMSCFSVENTATRLFFILYKSVTTLHEYVRAYIQLMEKWTNKQMCFNTAGSSSSSKVQLCTSCNICNVLIWHLLVPPTWHSAGHRAASCGQPSSLGEANRSLGSFNFATGLSVLLSVLISTWFVLSVFCRKLLR